VLRLRFHEADGPNDQIEVAYNAGDGSVSFAGDDGWERLTGENFRFEHRSAWSFKGTLSASRAFDGTLEEISSTRWDRDATVRECKRTIRLTGKP